MALSLAKMEDSYREIISFNKIILHFQNVGFSLDSILEELDKEREKLRQDHHLINFLIVSKNKSFVDIRGRKCVEDFSLLDGGDIYTYKMFFFDYSIECIVKYFDSSLYSLESVSKFISKLRTDLIDNELYLLKSDALSLVSDLEFRNDDIFFVKDCAGLDGDRSNDFPNERLYEEWVESKAVDLAFDLWVKDKKAFEQILVSISDGKLIMPEIIINDNTEEIEQLKSTINQQDEEIERLKAELETKMTESIGSYNDREKGTHLQIISGLVIELSKTSNKYKYGNKINISAISTALNGYSDLFEDARKQDAYRKQISTALQILETNISNQT